MSTSTPPKDRIGVETDTPSTRTAISDPRIARILDAVPPGGTVLDVGCVNHDVARADDANWLHKHLCAVAGDVVGIDILAADVTALQAQGYDARVADAEDFALDRTFDAVVAGELIEHLANPGGFLDSARDHLREDGRLVLTTPNPWGATYLKRLLLPSEVHCNEEHTCWFDKRTLRQLLERHGFAVVTHEYVRPPLRRDGHGEYLSWATWHLGRQRRLGALDHLVVATPTGDDA